MPTSHGNVPSNAEVPADAIADGTVGAQQLDQTLAAKLGLLSSQRTTFASATEIGPVGAATNGLSAPLVVATTQGSPLTITSPGLVLCAASFEIRASATEYKRFALQMRTGDYSTWVAFDTTETYANGARQNINQGYPHQTLYLSTSYIWVSTALIIPVDPAMQTVELRYSVFDSNQGFSGIYLRNRQFNTRYVAVV